MSRNWRWRKKADLGSLIVFACLGLAWLGSSGADEPAGSATAPTEDLFAGGSIPRIKIEVPAKSIERLRGKGWSWGWGGPTRERPEVEATVVEGGQVYTNVALHLKGSAGSFQPVDSKPGITLNFDKFVKGQTFHGLQKISLNNSVQDPSFSSEKICRELFNAAGVPAPRADYATVELNGRKLGLYVLLEGYNKQFLKRHFKSAKGNFYDGGFLKDVDSPLNPNATDAGADGADLRELARAAKAGTGTNRFAKLEKVLDMDRFITFMAMEVLVCHWDGYCMNKNNYRVYHDMDVDRMMFMPHGMDQVFGVMMVQASMPVRPPFQGSVARAVMDTPEGRRRYFERLAQLNRSVFDVENITNRIHQAAARVRPLLAESGASAVASHEREVVDLCDRIVQRKQSLEEQLGGAQGLIIEFDSDGIARLGSWTALTNYGGPLFSQETSSDGKPLLRIQTGERTGVGSWRTKVLLEEGHYAFEGRMQTVGIAADPRDRRAGAGLRVSNRPAFGKVLGSTGWKEVVCEFDVAQGIQDIELVCELRAAKGEAWFDADSLHLVRK
jgi:spore coat protein H